MLTTYGSFYRLFWSLPTHVVLPSSVYMISLGRRMFFFRSPWLRNVWNYKSFIDISTLTLWSLQTISLNKICLPIPKALGTVLQMLVINYDKTFYTTFLLYVCELIKFWPKYCVVNTNVIPILFLLEALTEQEEDGSNDQQADNNETTNS